MRYRLQIHVDIVEYISLDCTKARLISLYTLIAILICVVHSEISDFFCPVRDGA